MMIRVSIADGTQSQVESSSSAFEVERSTNSAEILAEHINSKSEVESSWSAFELKRDANILRNPDACDSQLMKCIEMNRSGCGRMLRSCPELVERCVHSRDQCEAGKSGKFA
ncbi:unnamed protein product [Anisakis simplex]|uniref:ShKT domain-containing protein n=1 Tax=Anisakis simplex TaxID=6269 RepID=A0A0M3JFF0_ANISI|nr:unnamed protein product [Anisakis simplex]